MIILACETSTLLGSVAILENGHVLASEESMRQGSHSDVLNNFIEKCLQTAGKNLADIDLFVSGIGPGSFTGIRISLNTIKTLAYCHQKPVIGINSLHTLAFQLFSNNSAEQFGKIPIISMINAYKNMVYVATYERQENGIKEVKGPEVIRVQNLPEYVSEKSLVCGDGFSAYQKFFPKDLSEKFVRIENASDEPEAKNLARLAERNPELQISWNKLLPLYLRSSEAEENLRGIKFQPLI